MGSSSSKVAGKAAGAATRRQYPSTSSIVNSAASTTHAPLRPRAPLQSSEPPAPSQVNPDPVTSPPAAQKSEHIDLDGRDPQFGSALRRIGPAKPSSDYKPEDAFPTSSQPMQAGQNIFPSTANNPAIILVQARTRFEKQWETENDDRGRTGFAGRTLLSARDIREALTLRDETGIISQDVEKQMRLKPGTLDRMVAKGIVANA